MKQTKIILGLFILFVLFTSSSFAQQEKTVTTTATNIIASRVAVDVPSLSNNPNAIIIATQIGTVDPHPIGAWYYNGKWHIFNLNHFNMPVGAIFKVEYFLTPGANQFLHVIPQSDEGQGYSVVDNPVLNTNPTAQVRIFQNHSDSRPASLNPNEANIVYDPGTKKWYIQNINQSTLHAKTAYNVVVTSGGASISTPPTGTAIGLPPVSLATPTSTSTSPTGNAGGDLSGTYPNPNVIGLQGKPLSNTAPVVGDTLRWNGTAWEPYTPPANSIVNANQLAGRDILTTAPTAGQVLKFGGGSWYPADDNVGTASTATSAIQMFSKRSPLGSQNLVANNSKPQTVIPALTQTIVLTKTSRLVISATVRFYGAICPVGCNEGEGTLYMKVANSAGSEADIDFLVPHDKTISASISNYTRDFGPGTYTIEFWVSHENGTSAFDVQGNYSSIMVIPL